MERGGGGVPGTPELALRQARLIAVALVVGVLLFWGVGFALQPAVGEPAISLDAALLIWGALAVGGFIGALVFRGRAASVAESARRSGAALDMEGRSRVTTNVIVAAALLEAPALFAGVMQFVSGHVALIPYAALVYLVGVALTFPRAEWYGVRA